MEQNVKEGLWILFKNLTFYLPKYCLKRLGDWALSLNNIQKLCLLVGIGLFVFSLTWNNPFRYETDTFYDLLTFDIRHAYRNSSLFYMIIIPLLGMYLFKDK